MVEDRAIMGRIANKWKEEHTGTEIKELENAVTNVMQEVFKLKTDIVSEHYSGEDFGKCIYYRVAYRSQEGKNVHIFLALEERLLMQTVGQLLDMQFKKVDELVVDATKQLSQQLMKRVGVCFGVPGQYQLDKDHLLTKEQFQREFALEYPYYSLLFDTGVGYFAFCTKIH